MTDSPRLQWNRELAAAYIKAAGSPPRYPKVSDQIECLPLQTVKLQPLGYNPTIMDWDGSIFMAYRYHSGDLSTKLAVARLSDTGEVISNWLLPIAGYGSFEDPKFFIHNGQGWLSFVQSNYPKGLNCVVKHGRFGGDHLKEIVLPAIGKNDFTAMEKNWVFFEAEGSLYVIYRCGSTQQIMRLEGSQASQPLESPVPHWPYGQPRGGTAPVPYEGKLLRFFHTHLQNELTPPHHRYYIGACLMDSTPPFAVTAISRRPILYASEADDLTPEQRKACKHWKQSVVFPGGVVAQDGYWLLAIGENDSACKIVKVKPENLNL